MRPDFVIKRALAEGEERIKSRNEHIRQLYGVIEQTRVLLIEGNAKDALALVEMTLPALPPAEPEDIKSEGPAEPATALKPDEPLTLRGLIEVLPVLLASRGQSEAPNPQIKVLEHRGAAPENPRVNVTEHAAPARPNVKVSYHK